MAADERVHRHETDIMPVAGIFRAGIAETCEQEHGSLRRLRSGLGGRSRLFRHRFLEARRRDDGRERVVAMQAEVVPAGSFTLRQVDAVAEREAGQVHLDGLGDRLGVRLKLTAWCTTSGCRPPSGRGTCPG